jgi:hypothetical protein
MYPKLQPEAHYTQNFVPILLRRLKVNDYKDLKDQDDDYLVIHPRKYIKDSGLQDGDWVEVFVRDPYLLT